MKNLHVHYAQYCVHQLVSRASLTFVWLAGTHHDRHHCLLVHFVYLLGMFVNFQQMWIVPFIWVKHKLISEQNEPNEMLNILTNQGKTINFYESNQKTRANRMNEKEIASTIRMRHKTSIRKAENCYLSVRDSNNIRINCELWSNWMKCTRSFAHASAMAI